MRRASEPTLAGTGAPGSRMLAAAQWMRLDSKDRRMEAASTGSLATGFMAALPRVTCSISSVQRAGVSSTISAPRRMSSRTRSDGGSQAA